MKLSRRKHFAISLFTTLHPHFLCKEGRWEPVLTSGKLGEFSSINFSCLSPSLLLLLPWCEDLAVASLLPPVYLLLSCHVTM